MDYVTEEVKFESVHSLGKSINISKTSSFLTVIDKPHWQRNHSHKTKTNNINEVKVHRC